MTSQSHADALLAAWQLLRAQGIAPELRLPVIDALCEIERARCSYPACGCALEWHGPGKPPATVCCAEYT